MRITRGDGRFLISNFKIDRETGAFAPIPGDADIGGAGVGLRLPKMRE